MSTINSEELWAMHTPGERNPDIQRNCFYRPSASNALAILSLVEAIVVVLENKG
jgi:hypothetical protein